MMFSCCKQHFA